MVSGDSHAGLTGVQFREYFESKHRASLDMLIEDNEVWYAALRSIGYPFSPQVLDLIDGRRAIRSGGDSGYYDPQRRLREAEAEGISAEVLHPSGPIGLSPFLDAGTRKVADELRAAGAEAHNRWLSEFCQTAPGRFVGVIQTYPWPDMDAAIKQILAGRDGGLGAVFLPFNAGVAGELPALWDRYWDPFFAACVDVDLPINLHVGFGMGPGAGAQTFRAAQEAAASSLACAAGELFAAENLFPTKRPLWQLMWGGALDRFPTLKFVFSEVHAEWVPPTLAYLDRRQAEGKSHMSLKPSEYWQRNFGVVATNPRPAEIQMRDQIGPHQLMFGTDFPHIEGTWPNTLDWLRATFSGTPEDQARLILGENAIKFYGLDRAQLQAVADRIGPRPIDILGEGTTIDPRLIDHFHKRSGYLKQPEFDPDVVSNAFEDDEQLRLSALSS
jgi:predicted TIM-barrel fold metal-dependent hydrolase